MLPLSQFFHVEAASWVSIRMAQNRPESRVNTELLNRRDVQWPGFGGKAVREGSVLPIGLIKNANELVQWI